MGEEQAPALKDIFDKARFRHIAEEMGKIHPGFDTKKFLKLSLHDLESLNLMQRLRRMTESLHATLPFPYRKNLELLKQLAPRINRGFVTLILPDYVGLYGLEDFDASMEALKFFTTFGSSEFAVREFIRRDVKRSLAVMEGWSSDDDEHVRRLASEGSRPRLPWSFRLEELRKNPELARPILENLRSDPSLYVRKSVANHLNDITKDHPEWVLARVKQWPMENAHTAWIVKRALRTLIKKGDPGALTVIGAGEKPLVTLDSFAVAPQKIRLGEVCTLSLSFHSGAKKSQRLVVDYVVHYVKKAGNSSGKVFKWKELTLAPKETVLLMRKQTIRNFTTRVHHSGKHMVDVMINGVKVASSHFDLTN